MTELQFRHLNVDWNAEPNAPQVEMKVEGENVRLKFLLNSRAYDAQDGEIGVLTFRTCSRFRWDATNDDAWFDGSGLFSGQAPKWGEFYEVFGDRRPVTEEDWDIFAPDSATSRQFLFYFRDDTLEMVADDWSFAKLGSK